MGRRKKVHYEGAQNPFIQTQNITNALKFKWSVSAPWCITPFPEGCKNTIAGRYLGHNPLQSLHFTNEKAEAPEGNVTYKVKTTSQAHSGPV